MMIRAVKTCDETADNRVKKGGGGKFLSDGILLSSFLLCLLPRVSGWHLSSALYTMIQRRLDAKSELVEFTETITLLI